MAPRRVHPILGYICGMCSDEEPYGDIAVKVLEAKRYAHDLETAYDELAAALRAIRGHYAESDPRTVAIIDRALEQQ